MQTEQQAEQVASAPQIAPVSESSESKRSKHGGKRPGAGRKPNLARRLLKGFSRDAIDDDPRLECDLMGPGYELDSRVRIKLESKVEMKKRGLDSPDADALALTFAQRVAVPAPEVRLRTFSLSDVTQWS